MRTNGVRIWPPSVLPTVFGIRKEHSKLPSTLSWIETEEMADSIPGARFVVLEQSAHLAALESPQEVNALIDDFLADQGDAED